MVGLAFHMGHRVLKELLVNEGSKVYQLLLLQLTPVNRSGHRHS